VIVPAEAIVAEPGDAVEPPVMDPATAAAAAAVVQAERASDVASAGPRAITPLEIEGNHRGRDLLISILIVLVVAAIVAGIIIAL
jgi:hypothetical protein